MKTLNPNTKKAKAFIEAYNANYATELWQVYCTFSTKKIIAHESCYRRKNEENGIDMRILSANTFQFTCGWRVGHNLRVETRDNSYIIPNAF